MGTRQESGASRPRISVSDEEIVLQIPGFAVLRAVYEAEGYYDEAAGGDPEEQDLYRIELLDRSRADQAADATEAERAGPLADLRLAEPDLRRLFPASRWDAAGGAPPLAGQYLLALGWSLRQEHGRESRQRLFLASAGWAPALIVEQYQALPLEWRESLEVNDPGQWPS